MLIFSWLALLGTLRWRTCLLLSQQSNIKAFAFGSWAKCTFLTQVFASWRFVRVCLCVWGVKALSWMLRGVVCLVWQVRLGFPLAVLRLGGRNVYFSILSFSRIQWKPKSSPDSLTSVAQKIKRQRTATVSVLSTRSQLLWVQGQVLDW